MKDSTALKPQRSEVRLCFSSVWCACFSDQCWQSTFLKGSWHQLGFKNWSRISLQRLCNVGGVQHENGRGRERFLTEIKPKLSKLVHTGTALILDQWISKVSCCIGVFLAVWISQTWTEEIGVLCQLQTQRCKTERSSPEAAAVHDSPGYTCGPSSASPPTPPLSHDHQ